MIIKITPDKQKAQALMKMADITLKRLNETSMQSYPSNTLVDYYDIIHKLLEAIAFLDGIKIKGEGAHQELIDYVSEKYFFEEQMRHFLQQLRDYRNRISYEGFMINWQFIDSNKQKINTLINLLMKKVKL